MARSRLRKQSSRLHRRGRGQLVRHSRVLIQESVLQSPSFLGRYLVTRALPTFAENRETIHSSVEIGGEVNAGTQQGLRTGTGESSRQRRRRERKERRKFAILSRKTNDTKAAKADSGARDDSYLADDNDFTVDNDDEDDGYEDQDLVNDIDFVFENAGENDESDDVETNYEDDGSDEDDEDDRSENNETDHESDEDDDEEADEDGEDDEVEHYSNDQEMADDDGMEYDDASGELVPRPPVHGKWLKNFLRKKRRDEKRDEVYYGTLPS